MGGEKRTAFSLLGGRTELALHLDLRGRVSCFDRAGGAFFFLGWEFMARMASEILRKTYLQARLVLKDLPANSDL